MRKAVTRSTTTMRAVIFDRFGNVKRDYGIMGRHSDNPMVQKVYKFYYGHVKRRWIDAMYWLELK